MSRVPSLRALCLGQLAHDAGFMEFQQTRELVIERSQPEELGIRI
jgi:hypothetical protein